MLNTNTHILYEPYENEDYFNKNNFSLDDFIQKSSDIISSIKNIDNEDIELFKELDYNLIQEIITIDLPPISNTEKLIIYQYSNSNELYNLMSYLNFKLKDVFSLSTSSTLYDMNNAKEILTETIEELSTGAMINEMKEFTQYKDLIKSFDMIIDILNTNLYNDLIEWIADFPNKLITMKINKIGDEIKTSEEKDVYINSGVYKSKIENEDLKKEIKELKKEIVILIFKVYNTLVQNIVNTKTFWNSFIDLFVENNNLDQSEISYASEYEYILDNFEKDFSGSEPVPSDDLFFDEYSNQDESDDDEEELTDSDINMILNDLDEDENTNTNIETSFGSEKLHMGKGGAFGGSGAGPIPTSSNVFKRVGGFFKAFPGKINRIRKQFKLFRMRAKNHGFYMKYLGRIDGLYERYADEAPVLENGMKGDPVEILKEEGHNYIDQVSNGFIELQHSLIDLSKKFASIGDPKQMFSLMKSFGGMYMGDANKANTIPHYFLKSIKFKLGELILKNNKIYGYTPQSIAENGKFPPSNHAIVSLFVDRPDEKPFEQKVSDIFKSVDSFKLIAKNEKEPIFELSVTCSDLLTKGIQEASYKQLKINRKSNNEKFRMGIRDLVSKEVKKKKAAKELRNQYKACWKALEKAYEFITSKKNYIADLVESYFVMMTRIDNLCKVCVTAMLHVETDHRDATGYKTGFKADNLNSHKGYTQWSSDAENRKTVGEKQREKMAQKEEKHAAYREARTTMINRAKSIKKAMKHGFMF